MAILNQEITSVFCVKRPSSPPDAPDGTAFLVKVSGQLFLITARHVVFDKKTQQVVVPDFYRHNQWYSSPASPSNIISSSVEDDIAIFPIDQPSDGFGDALKLGGVYETLGAPALIAGFPYGWHRASHAINGDCPVAIVKEVLIGGMINHDDRASHNKLPSVAIILDRGIPRGFSGSPVFYRNPFGGIGGIPDTTTVLGVVINHIRTDEMDRLDIERGLGLATSAQVPMRLIKEFLGERP